MRKLTPFRCQAVEPRLHSDPKGRKILCNRLINLALLTILSATLTQSGCVGLTSTGNPSGKSSTNSAGTNSLPKITASPLPNAQLGVQFQQSLDASGGVQPYLWNIPTGKLPPGITLNAATGVISGVSSQGGQFDFSAQVSDSSSPTPQIAMKALRLFVLTFALQISPSPLPTGQVGVPYEFTLTGNGGITPYTWGVLGSLPTGLILNTSSGTITGTPKVAETSAFMLSLTDSTGHTALMKSSIKIATAGSAQNPVLSPVQPVVQPGGTQQFRITANPGTGGTFTCTNTSNGGPCLGSITSGGFYTAPTTLAANQSLGGYQLLPNDHIFNTRIDNLPADTGGATFSIDPSPRGVVRKGGITTVYYMRSPGVQPPAGATVIISGVADPSFNGMETVINVGGCPGYIYTCFTYSNLGPDTVSGGGSVFAPYIAAMGPNHVQYLESLPVNYADGSTPTDNISFYYTPANNGLFQTPQWPDANIQGGWFDARSGNPNVDHHMIVIDTTTGNLNERYQYYPIGANSTCPRCNSQSGIKYAHTDYALPPHGATDAAGLMVAPLTLHSQEVTTACSTGGAIKHALRMTLSNFYIKRTFVWPATTNAFPSGTVPYGMRFRLKSSFDISGFSPCAQILLTQLKDYGVFLADGGMDWQITTDFDNTPSIPSAAMKEINSAGIAVTNWEAVDESSLEMSPNSGAASNGEVVTYTSSTGSVKTNVNLQGTAVNVNTNQYYIMAGTPTQQLIGYSNSAVTWSMNPTVGTLTAGGLYTPPASVSTMTTTTVTVTSTVNPLVTAQMIVYVLPSTNFRLMQGTANHTDSHGNVWYAGYGIGLSNAPSWQGCCQNDGSFVSIPDKQLWWNHYLSSQTANDIKMDFHVPAGIYTITFNNGTHLRLGANKRHFFVQGSLITTIDPTALVGGPHLPYTFTTIVTVGSNNTLSIYNAGSGQEQWSGGDISSIQITPQ